MWEVMSSAPSAVCRYRWVSGHYVRIGVLLNHQRRGCMLAENGEQSGFRVFAARQSLVQPSLDLAGEFIQSLTVSCDVDLMGLLLHSTVTLLARLRG